MHWGQKYEDVSIMWYENRYDTHVLIMDVCHTLHSRFWQHLQMKSIHRLDHDMEECLKLKILSTERLLAFQNRNIGFKCNYKWKYVS